MHLEANDGKQMLNPYSTSALLQKYPIGIQMSASMQNLKRFWIKEWKWNVSAFWSLRYGSIVAERVP
jgi:hypothetical protein